VGGLVCAAGVGFVIPVSPVAAVALAALPIGAWALRRLDVWRFLALPLLAALAAAASSQGSLRAVAGASRFVLLAALTALVLVHRRPPHPFGLRADAHLGAARASGVAFVVLAAVSAAWSPEPANTLSQVLVLVLTVVSVTLAAGRRWPRPEIMASDLRALLAVLVALSAVSLVGAAIHAPFAYGYEGRYTGFFTSATSTGMVAAFAIPLAWALKSTSPRRWVYWASILLCGATLVISESRGSIVAVAGAAAWIAWRGGSGRRVRIAAIGVFGVVATFWVAPVLGYDSPLAGVVERFVPDEDQDYATTRLRAWEVAVQGWKDRPLAGHGFRSTEHLFQQERAAGVLEFRPDTTHNGFLQVLLELGVIGSVLFTATMAPLLIAGARGRSAIATGLFGAVMVGVLLQLTESPIFGTGSLFPFVFATVVAAAIVAERAEQSASGRSREVSDELAR